AISRRSASRRSPRPWAGDRSVGCYLRCCARRKPPALGRGSFGWLLLARPGTPGYPSRNSSPLATPRSPMQVSEYQLQELQFAYASHAFLHWRPPGRNPHAPRPALAQTTLPAWVEPLGLHVLECDSRSTETRAMVSLRPDEPLSACASKL